MVVRAAFVQALLARRVVPYRDAAALHARLAAAAGEDGSLNADLAALHTDLARLGLEVRTCHDQRTGDAFLVLVNTKADALAELATPYTAVELAYIKSVIAALLRTAPRFALPSTAALQLAAPAQLTKRAAADLLTNLEERGWVHLSHTTGSYTLTLRALHELDTYLRHEAEDEVLECCGAAWQATTPVGDE
ncbi:hypothetical protein CBS14141_000756 [Malassezia furfur]|nr:hypothetical protein CBS14141_000756 [Malassezia furfur]